MTSETRVIKRARFGVVVHTILMDGQRVYLLKRAPEVAFGGLWSLPGGYVESGEGLAEAAIRECFEEVGVRLANPSLLGVMSYRSRESEDELSQGYNFIFLGQSFEGTPQNCEPAQFSEGGYVAVDTLPEDCVRWLPDALGFLGPDRQTANAQPTLNVPGLVEYVWD
ncbi:MAG: NUDIX domain-containing protein [Pseudomonadota bacterium]